MDLNPRLFNRQLIHTARGVNLKTPWLFTFARHMESGHYWAWKPRSATFTRDQTLFRQVHRIWRGTRLAMPKTILRAGLIVIEAWFGGY